MNKKKWFGLIFTLVAAFLIVYSIRFRYPFPYHLDEWNHITFAKKLGETSIFHVEIGFHYFLLAISLLGNLILFYKFLPALWAVFSAATLFFLVYKKSNKNYLLAILSIIFFVSIKSNNNLLGLWFFTPLTFSIPLIFLFIYFFTEGIERKNKNYILTSLAIMIFLIPFHAISVTFAIPILISYVLIWHKKYVIKEWKFFSFFLLIPLIGALFLKVSMNIDWSQIFDRITDYIIFKKGWGVSEYSNSPFEIYSLIGYLFSFLGIFLIIKRKEKKFYIFLIWFGLTLALIILFRITEISLIVPYQRALYYLALSLPLLSAFGVYEIIKRIKKIDDKLIENILIMILIIFVIFTAFFSYYKVPDGLKPVKFITQEDYAALTFLKEQPKGRVLTEDLVFKAVYPIAEKYKVVDTLNYLKRVEIIMFFSEYNCSEKNEFIEKENINYVLSSESFECGWEPIYNKDKRFIYKIK